MLKLLGRIGKGVATVAGLGGIAASGTAYAVAPAVAVDPSIIELIRELSVLVGAVSGALAAFGVGRKAGYAVHKES